MARLNDQELRELLSVTRVMINLKGELLTINGLARYISNIKLPTKLSEGLAEKFLNNNQIINLTNYKYRKGRRQRVVNGKKIRESDIVGELFIDNIPQSPKNIEIKAFGINTWTRHSDNDVKADYLIWMDFYEALLNRNHNLVNCYLVNSPNAKTFSIKGDAHLNKLLAGDYGNKYTLTKCKI